MKRIIIVKLFLLCLTLQGEEMEVLNYRLKEKLWNNNVNEGSIHHPLLFRLGPTGIYRYEYDELGRLIKIRHGRKRRILYEFIYIGERSLKVRYDTFYTKILHFNEKEQLVKVDDFGSFNENIPIAEFEEKILNRITSLKDRRYIESNYTKFAGVYSIKNRLIRPPKRYYKIRDILEKVGYISSENRCVSYLFDYNEKGDLISYSWKPDLLYSRSSTLRLLDDPWLSILYLSNDKQNPNIIEHDYDQRGRKITTLFFKDTKYEMRYLFSYEEDKIVITRDGLPSTYLLEDGKVVRSFSTIEDNYYYYDENGNVIEKVSYDDPVNRRLETLTFYIYEQYTPVDSSKEKRYMWERFIYP